MVMNRDKRYHFNYKTLSFETAEIPSSRKVLKGVALFLGSVLAAAAYLTIYVSVAGETPKQKLLEHSNASLASRLELVNNRLDIYQERLGVLAERDNTVYRSIFGMEEMSSDVRDAGYGGTDRYSRFKGLDRSGILSNTVKRIDMLNKKAYVQSLSFDDVYNLSRQAGDMASCIPAIPPITTDPGVTRYSSSFGYRSDPGNKQIRMHSGVDLAAPTGTPIHATGKGRVCRVSYDYYGYGHYVLIDHGFGYKTRYGHMSKIAVHEGQEVDRGQYIGDVGNTGRSFGSHVHYEVIYKDRCVNPVNYFDMEMSPEDYAAMVVDD